MNGEQNSQALLDQCDGMVRAGGSTITMDVCDVRALVEGRKDERKRRRAGIFEEAGNMAPSYRAPLVCVASDAEAAYQSGWNAAIKKFHNLLWAKAKEVRGE